MPRKQSPTFCEVTMFRAVSSRRLTNSSSIAGVIFGCCLFSFLSHEYHKPLFRSLSSGNDGNHTDTFHDDFNNETAADSSIVANIIHFIRFEKFQLDFVGYVLLKVAIRNHRPDNFFFHTNIKNATCEGKYWQWVKNDTELSRVQVKYLEASTEIFGQKLRKSWRFYHGRIRVIATTVKQKCFPNYLIEMMR